MDKDSFFIKSQISSNINNVRNLLNTGVFEAPILKQFHEPVFVSIILKLNDLLQKFDKLGNRINFNDDIDSGDITDLINKIRNAICHLDSPENLLDKKTEIKFVFNMVIGKVNAIVIGDKIVAKSDYDDDIAIFYGEYRIYLKRHIIRIINESIKVYEKLYSNK
jgi:hypothetical protein